jgi:hypothetical protein
MPPPFPHLRVERFFEIIEYSKKPTPRNPPIEIELNRGSHGQGLQREIESVRRDYEDNIAHDPPGEHVSEQGLILEFESAPDFELASQSLDNRSFQLLNLKEQRDASGKTTYKARVFVAEGQLDKLEKKIADYLGAPNKSGKQPNQALIDHIAGIRGAAVRELWVEAEAFPDTDEAIWWEVWLRIGLSGPQARVAIEEQFKGECTRLEITVGRGRLEFPEHTIVMVKGRPEQLSASIHLLNCIAEIRKPREFADFFDGLPAAEQRQWIDSLLERLVPNENPNCHVCLLDTGLNIGNPVIGAVVDASDSHTITETWGTADEHDHGTSLASLSIFGDLAEAISGSGNIALTHGLESVKIVPPFDNDEEDFAAYFTQQGVYVAQIAHANRRRIYCLASTFRATQTGKPSSWSTALDMLSAGSDDAGSPCRLFVVGIGNVGFTEWTGYPGSNDAHSAETPSQSWNALSVGGYTNKTRLSEENSELTVVAGNGALAPSSRTAVAWAEHRNWPLKPDVVFEAGNAAIDPAPPSVGTKLPELSLLTASAKITERLFTYIDGTSASAALGARFAARVQSEFPDYWPETVRALIVHSAEWTEAMIHSLSQRFTKKQQYAQLVRRCGFGVPNLNRALQCGKNRATLIAQREFQPFHSDGKADPKFHELDFVELPLPGNFLRENASESVRVRVTLSYFIEPNPGTRSPTSQYRYASCGLRFKLSSANQKRDAFLSNITQAIQSEEEEDDEDVPSESDRWLLGENARHKGSVHSDIWEGSAVDLVERQIAIYPVSGWWKLRKHLNRFNSSLRYSIVVTIEAENKELDIYTPIEAMVSIPITT